MHNHKFIFTVITVSLIVPIFLLVFGISDSMAEDSAKEISVEEICGLYLDEPMSADSLYKDKTVSTSVKVGSVRKIRSLCEDATHGTFTLEILTPEDKVIQCLCNAPDQKSVLDTSKGTNLNIQGTFKSLTATFFETESKQCTLTFESCTFDP